MRKTLLFLYLLSLGSIAAYGQTRLTQDPKLERQLHESGLIHQPLPLDIENSFETNGWKKEVLQSAPLTRSAGTEGWSHSGAGSMSFSTEKTVSGKGSIKLQFPTFTGKRATGSPSDPDISVSLTDTVMHCLQNYITDYRTNKARHDLAFTEKLYGEAKASYEDAQKKYANFVDANQNIILLSYRAEQERLQNEMNLAYQVYTQVSQQLQMARAKVQEITPVYTVVQPATVPLKPAKPNKLMILIGFMFLAGVGSVGWILFVKDLLKGWKKQTI